MCDIKTENVCNLIIAAQKVVDNWGTDDELSDAISDLSTEVLFAGAYLNRPKPSAHDQESSLPYRQL